MAYREIENLLKNFNSASTVRYKNITENLFFYRLPLLVYLSLFSNDYVWVIPLLTTRLYVMWCSNNGQHERSQPDRLTSTSVPVSWCTFLTFKPVSYCLTMSLSILRYLAFFNTTYVYFLGALSLVFRNQIAVLPYKWNRKNYQITPQVLPSVDSVIWAAY